VQQEAAELEAVAGEYAASDLQHEPEQVAPSGVIPLHQEAAELEAVIGEHAGNGLQHEPEQATIHHD
jgi:hypothetical protein